MWIIYACGLILCSWNVIGNTGGENDDGDDDRGFFEDAWKRLQEWLSDSRRQRARRSANGDDEEEENGEAVSKFSTHEATIAELGITLNGQEFQGQVTRPHSTNSTVASIKKLESTTSPTSEALVQQSSTTDSSLHMLNGGSTPDVYESPVSSVHSSTPETDASVAVPPTERAVPTFPPVTESSNSSHTLVTDSPVSFELNKDTDQHPSSVTIPSFSDAVTQKSEASMTEESTFPPDEAVSVSVTAGSEFPAFASSGVSDSKLSTGPQTTTEFPESSILYTGSPSSLNKTGFTINLPQVSGSTTTSTGTTTDYSVPTVISTKGQSIPQITEVPLVIVVSDLLQINTTTPSTERTEWIRLDNVESTPVPASESISHPAEHHIYTTPRFLISESDLTSKETTQTDSLTEMPSTKLMTTEQIGTPISTTESIQTIEVDDAQKAGTVEVTVTSSSDFPKPEIGTGTQDKIHLSTTSAETQNEAIATVSTVGINIEPISVVAVTEAQPELQTSQGTETKAQTTETVIATSPKSAKVTSIAYTPDVPTMEPTKVISANVGPTTDVIKAPSVQVETTTIPLDASSTPPGRPEILIPPESSSGDLSTAGTGLDDATAVEPQTETTTDGVETTSSPVTQSVFTYSTTQKSADHFKLGSTTEEPEALAGVPLATTEVVSDSSMVQMDTTKMVATLAVATDLVGVKLTTSFFTSTEEAVTNLVPVTTEPTEHPVKSDIIVGTKITESLAEQPTETITATSQRQVTEGEMSTPESQATPEDQKRSLTSEIFPEKTTEGPPPNSSIQVTQEEPGPLEKTQLEDTTTEGVVDATTTSPSTIKLDSMTEITDSMIQKTAIRTEISESDTYSVTSEEPIIQHTSFQTYATKEETITTEATVSSSTIQQEQTTQPIVGTETYKVSSDTPEELIFQTTESLSPTTTDVTKTTEAAIGPTTIKKDMATEIADSGTQPTSTKPESPSTANPDTEVVKPTGPAVDVPLKPATTTTTESIHRSPSAPSLNGQSGLTMATAVSIGLILLFIIILICICAVIIVGGWVHCRKSEPRSCVSLISVERGLADEIGDSWGKSRSSSAWTTAQSGAPPATSQQSAVGSPSVPRFVCGCRTKQFGAHNENRLCMQHGASQRMAAADAIGGWGRVRAINIISLADPSKSDDDIRMSGMVRRRVSGASENSSTDEGNSGGILDVAEMSGNAKNEWLFIDEA